MAQCPRCKEDMPALSKICPVCGYMAEGDENNISAGELADILEANLYNIKNIPAPSFAKSMWQLTFIIFPFLAIDTLILAAVMEGNIVAWGFFILFLILSVIVIYKKTKGTLGNQKVNKLFKEYKNVFEYNKRIASRSFGKNKEVSNLINEISAEIHSIEKSRKSMSARNLTIWVIILAVLLGLISFTIFKTGSDATITDKIETAAKSGDWKEAIEDLKSMPEDDPNIEQTRMDITKSMLAAGNVKSAEDFFAEYCMGKMMDYDCAEQIVNYYKDKDDKQAAEDFIGRCSAMRYKSDIAKLKNIIK